MLTLLPHLGRAPVLVALLLGALPAGADQEPGRRPTPAPLGPASDPAVEHAYERAMATEADPSATVERKRDAWCALAALNGPANPYLSGARTACEEWRAFAVERVAAVERMRGDYERLRALLALARPGKEERLRVVDDFLAVHAALHGEPAVRAVAEARIELDQADSPEAAREVSLPLIRADGVREEGLELEIDLGPVSLLYGADEGGAIGHVGLVVGGLEPFSEPWDGSTRKLGLESFVAAGSPIEVGALLAYRDGTYAPGRTRDFDARWSGVALGMSLGVTLISAPDLNEYESSLLNLSGGVALEGVLGSRPTERSSYVYGTVGAYAANTIFLGCSTALRVAWVEAISHEDLFPSHLEATIGFDARERCNPATP